MKNITLGQYYPTESILHKLDARLKLFAVCLFVALLFVVAKPVAYLIPAAAMITLIIISHVPAKQILNGLRAILTVVAFTAVLNLFFTPGEQVFFEWGVIRFTLEGLYTAARMLGRLSLLVIATSLLTLTTTPMQLTDAIEFALKPLKVIGLPAHELAMMMTIALRFIPTLSEELDKITKAQMSRGADFDTGGLLKKAKALIPLLVPLFVSAFRRAYELANAMESRCYRGDVGRTRMKVMRFSRRDYCGLCMLCVFSAVVLAVNWL